MIAPDVCVRVEYRGRRYRVESWYCEATVKPNTGLGAVLFEASHDFGGGVRMRSCMRHEATHLGLVGVCGAIAPISDCEVLGRIEWSEGMISDAREFAEALGREGEIVF